MIGLLAMLAVFVGLMLYPPAVYAAVVILMVVVAFAGDTGG